MPRTIIQRLLCLASLTTLGAIPGLAGNPKIAEGLDTVDAGAPVDVIVVYREGARAGHFERLARYALRSRGKLANVNAESLTIRATDLEALANDPDVEVVAPNREVRAALDVVAPTVGADLVWAAGRTGTGVGVAVIDSGVNEKIRDFGDALGRTDATSNYGRVVYSENFLVPKTRTDGTANPARYEGKDEYGHGTHVAGIIAGNGYISLKDMPLRVIKGIAPTARIINLKVLDKNGVGNDAAVIEAIDRAIKLKGSYNIRVINLSLGRRIYQTFGKDPLCLAVERAWKAGIVVVVAAGNEGRLRDFGLQGYGTIQSPANHPLVITVGAMRTAGTPSRADDEITTYSSRGPTAIDHIVKPDLVAPGNLIDSNLSDGTLSKTYPANRVDPLTYSGKATLTTKSAYLNLSGTSMAAGVTSGAVALLLSSEPKLTPDQVKARLMLTATKTFSSRGLFYFDYSVRARKMSVAAQRARLALPEFQKAVTEAKAEYDTALAAVQAAQAVVDQATPAEQTARANLDAANAALAVAQANYDAALGQQQAASQAVVTAKAVWEKSVRDAKAAQDAANSCKDPVAKVPLQAHADQLAAVAAANGVAYQNGVAALKAAESASAAAKNVRDAAKSAQSKAASALSSAQNNLASANNRLNEARAKLVEPQAELAAAREELASQQADLAAIEQQATYYTGLSQSMQSDPESSYPAQYDIFTVGAGYLDIAAAVLNKSAVAPAGKRAFSLVAYYDPATQTVQTTGNYTSLCADSALWGSSALWGTTVCGGSALWGTNALWGSNALWGTSAVWGYNVFLQGSSALWGSSAVWGSANTQGFNALWGTSAVWGYSAVWGTTVQGSSAIDVLIDGDLVR